MREILFFVLLIWFLSVFLIAYFMEKLERRLKLEVFLRQLENDSDRDVRESTNLTVSGDDSRMDETLEQNRTSYLDETIECEPSLPSSVPEVVVVEEDDEQDQLDTTRAGSADEEEVEEEKKESSSSQDTQDQRP